MDIGKDLPQSGTILRPLVLLGLLLALVAAGLSPRVMSHDEPGEASQRIQAAVSLLELMIDIDTGTARQCFEILLNSILSGQVAVHELEPLRPKLQSLLDPILDEGPAHDLFAEAALLACTWQYGDSREVVRQFVADDQIASTTRRRALQLLLYISDDQALKLAARVLEEDADASLKSAAIGALARLNEPRVGELVLQVYDRLDDSLQPQAVELLTQRAEWSKQLLQAIDRQQLSPNVLNANQVAQLQASPDESLRELVRQTWGIVRSQRDPQREQVIQQMRRLLAEIPGDPFHGEVVYHRVCGQCHKMHGRGEEVGPDVTSNGRNSYEQLLSNVFDPNLVIGADYQTRQVITEDGRVLSGLVVEESERRLVLKIQGGEVEVIAGDEIEEMRVSPLSLMPEGLEDQLEPQELADLFAFLTFDKHPSDPAAAPIPGTDIAPPRIRSSQ